MSATVRRTLAVLAALTLFAGALSLDGALDSYALHYAVIVGAAAILVALRMFGGDAGAVPRADAPARYWLYAAPPLVVAIACSVWLTFPTQAPRLFTGPEQLMLWAAIGAGAVLAAHLCDRRRDRQSTLDFRGRDWLIMLALFVAGTASRLWNLTLTPPALAFDEAWPFARTLQLLVQANLTPFHVDDFAMSAIYHYVSGASIVLFSWTGLDTLQAAKLPNVLFGGVSVALVYAAVRIVADRRIAATAALFLVWLTWPWILSRMHYSYSGDLMWVALATTLVMAGFAADRMALARPARSPRRSGSRG